MKNQSSLGDPAFTPEFIRLDRDSADGSNTGDDPAKVVVYWMNHAGGGLTMLSRVARSLAADLPIEIHSAPMPARESLIDLVFDGDLETMADQLARQIIRSRETAGDTRPFVIIGHSFGSILAYRTTASLIQHHSFSKGTVKGTTQHIPHRLVVLSFPAADQMTHEESLHQLSDAGLVAKVDSLFGGVPKEMLDDAEAQKVFAPALRFDLGMLERYEYDPSTKPLSVPITAIAGTEDRAVNLAQMQRWSQMTSGDFRLRAMPGDHFFPLSRMTDVLRVAAWEWWEA